MAMGDRLPTRSSPPSRLTCLPPLHSFVSGSNSAMRLDSYATAPGGLSQNSSISPTLERRTQDRTTFPSLTNSTSDPTYVGQPSIRIRYPGTLDVPSLRLLLLSLSPITSRILPSDHDRHYSVALASFQDVEQARYAQNALNGRSISDDGASMLVELLGNEDDHFTSRRNTNDGVSVRQQSISGASSASSNTNSLARHTSGRFSFSTANQGGSPPFRSPDAGSNLQSLFASSSPNGISGNSLRDDHGGDDGLLDEISKFNEGYSSSRRSMHTSDALSSPFSNLSIATNMTNGHGTGVLSPTDPSVVSPRTYSAVQSPSTITPPGNNTTTNGWNFTRPRQSMPPANPADQNPPCNTLYVGNLPPNTCEEELKTLFSKQRGYRRLCFRTKNNGPMCFVEFEDINYAAQCLDTLYGTMLTNSVKGGIRLSFSKNPLGVRRDTSGPSSPMSPQAMMNGVSNGPGAPFATANGPPPGLPVPQPRGQGSFSHVPPHSHQGRHNQAYASTMRSQPSPAGYASPSLNGHFAGMNGAQQQMFNYPNTANAPYGSMANGI